VGGAVALSGAALSVAGLKADHLDLLRLDASPWMGTAFVVAGVVLFAAGLLLLAGAIERRHLRAERIVPFLIALAVYGGVYAVTWDQLPPRGDEPHYMLEAYSLAIDHDRNLAKDYTDPKRIAPMFGSFAAGAHTYNYSGDPNVAISVHSVGVPALLVPPAALSNDVRLMRIEMLLVAAGAAYLLLSILRRVAGRSSPLVYATWAAFAFSLPLISYSSQVYPEIPGAFLVLLVVRLLLEPELSPRITVLAATACSLLPWLHIRFSFLSVVLLGALLIRISRAQERVPGLRRWISNALPALVPVAVSAALLGVANQHWYASPWLTAPYRLARPRPQFDVTWGYTHSVGGIFDPAYGWLPVAPVHVLAVVGLVYLCWQGRKWAISAAAVAVIYLLVVVSEKGIVGGFAFPGRLQVVLIPLGAIPLLLLVKEVRAMAIVAVPLAALTFALSVVGVARIDSLIYSDRRSNASHMPLARSLAVAWPRFQGAMGDDRYRGWPKVVAWVAGITAAGSVLGVRARLRRAPDPSGRPISLGSE
jgi:hypothetical protein